MRTFAPQPTWLSSKEMTPTITLTVPGTLRYRGIAVRVVAEAARLVSGSVPRDPDEPVDHDVRDPFDTAVVSAFMEIFNNVVIHAYRREDLGPIRIAITPSETGLVIEIEDQGCTFDLSAVAPLSTDHDLDALPEGGMGLHIARSMLDEVTYEPGPPNLWRLCKRLPASQVAREEVGRS